MLKDAAVVVVVVAIIQVQCVGKNGHINMLHVDAAKVCWSCDFLALRTEFFRTESVKPALFTVDVPAYDGCQRFFVGF